MPVSDTNEVQVCGDESNLIVRATALTSATTVDFNVGSFKGSAEENRLVNLVLDFGAKTFNLRLKWTDPMFNRTSITGSILPRARNL